MARRTADPSGRRTRAAHCVIVAAIFLVAPSPGRAVTITDIGSNGAPGVDGESALAVAAGAGATNVGLVTFLIPVSAILLGVLVLGETLAMRHVAGMVLIGAGLILIDGRLVSALGAWFTAKEPAPRGNG